jgi:DNA (cytosine-5)-methyltransferase 1
VTTTDTSGQSVPAPFALYDPKCALWSRAQTSLLSLEGTSFAKSSVTWPKQGSMRNGRSYRHQTWVRPTSVHASSLLPTPTAGNPNDGEDLESWEARRQLNPNRSSRAALTAESHWSAPSLEQVVELASGELPREYETWDEVQGWHGKLLPTPTVMDAASSRNSTANRSDPNSTHHSGETLLDALTLLPTPRTTDGQGGGRHGDGGLDLRTTAQTLADAEHAGPLCTEAGETQGVSGEGGGTDWGKYTPAIRRWERIFRPAPAPRDGKGRLNVDLTEWMMGAPKSWCEGLSRTAAIRGYGNAVVVQVAEAVALWALEGL